MLNIAENVDVSGPTSRDCGHLRKMAPHLGISLSNRVRALVADADFEEKQRAGIAVEDLKTALVEIDLVMLPDHRL